MVGVKRAIQNYQIDDPNFDSSRELDLLQGMIEAIDGRSEEAFVKKVGAYLKTAPPDRVKNQLFAKVKEVHVPDQSAVAGVVNKMSQLDFTGAGDDEKPSRKRNDNDDDNDED